MPKRTMIFTAGFIAVFLLIACGQPSGNNNVSQQQEKAVLSIQAAIVYQYGGAQPVARTDFFLLDDSLESILKEAGLEQGNNSSRLAAYYLALKYPGQHPDFHERATAALRPHIIKSTMTDFEGRAQFEPAPVGNYYVFGIAETRGGRAIWNLGVNLKSGQNQLILDQNNAASAY